MNNFNKAGLFLLVIVSSFLFLFCSCNFTSPKEQTTLKKIYVSSHFTIVFLDGKLENVDDSVCIIYYNNFVLCQLPFHYSLEDEEKILIQEIRYKYFGFEKNKVYGFMFDSLGATNGERLLVDSILNSRLMGRTNFYSIFKDYSRIYSKTDGQTGNIYERYKSNLPNNENYCDTLSFTFSPKLKSIDYSFSKEIDSIKNLKLYKVSMLFTEKYSPTYKMLLPKREYRLELNEVSPGDSKKLLEFFEKFKRYSTEHSM